ncbi:hypothetical protein IWW36_005815, partial [Coemansia brasiliensis]
MVAKSTTAYSIVIVALAQSFAATPAAAAPAYGDYGQQAAAPVPGNYNQNYGYSNALSYHSQAPAPYVAQQPAPYHTQAPAPYATQQPAPYHTQAPEPYITQQPAPYTTQHPTPYVLQPTHRHIPNTYYTQEPEPYYMQVPAYAPYSSHLPTIYSTIVETCSLDPSTITECHTDTTSI